MWHDVWGGVQVGAVAGRDISMTVVQHTDPLGIKQNTVVLTTQGGTERFVFP